MPIVEAAIMPTNTGVLTLRRDSIDAPSWLWQAVVAMAGAHEVGYLEHCRRFGLNG